MSTVSLTSIETRIIELLIKDSVILDLINFSIEKAVNKHNGTNNILLPYKGLNMDILVNGTYSNSQYYLTQSDYRVDNITNIIKTATNGVDRNTLLYLIIVLQRKIMSFDNNIQNITPKVDIRGYDISGIFYLLLNPEVSFIALLENNTIITRYINENNDTSINNDDEIILYSYSTLLLYYISLQYTESYVEYLNKYLLECVQHKKIGFLSIGLRNFYPREQSANESQNNQTQIDHSNGHATMMIFNGINSTLEYFDPNGETEPANYYNKKAKDFFSKVFSKVTMKTVNFQPTTIDGKTRNIQGTVSAYKNMINKKYTFDFGICGLYSAWFLHQRLMHITNNDYYNRLVNNKIDESLYITQSQFQYSKLARYYKSQPLSAPKKNIAAVDTDANINPIFNYETINNSLINTTYHQKIALTNHESILKYGLSFLKKTKINGVSIWDNFGDIIQKNSRISDVHKTYADVINNEITERRRQVVKDIKNERYGACYYGNEVINDHYMYLYNELRLLTTNYEETNNNSLYVSDQLVDDFRILQNATKLLQIAP